MSNYSSLFRVLSPSRVQTKFEENSPTLSTDIMLGCIVLGEENAFPVDFDTNKTIGHLKGAIKEKKSIALGNTDANELILWHVSIPEKEKHEIYEGINIEEKFGGVKLVSDLKTIGQEFKKQPPSEHIHIIVELPATTALGKRKTEDLDEGNGNKKYKEIESLENEAIKHKISTFINSLNSIDTNKQVLELPRLPGDVNKTSIYKRECYNYLRSSILNNNLHNRFLITGNPGIGKTYFGRLMLVELLKIGKKVLFDSKDCTLYIDPNGNTYQVDSYEYKLFAQAKDTWCIIDGRPPQISHDWSAGKFIMVSSPQRAIIKDFDKPRCKTFYMPTWDEDELLECWKSLYKSEITEETIKRKFNLCGGIPRWIFDSEMDSEKIRKMIVSASESIDSCILDYQAKLFFGHEFSHKIIHIHTNLEDTENPYTDSICLFASKFAGNKCIDHLKRHNKEKLRTFILSARNIKEMGALRGQLFELLSHEILCRGGRFLTRKLTDRGTEPEVLKEFESDLEERIFWSVDEIKHDIQQGQKNYYRPNSDTFESIDSYIYPNKMFQITVSRGHDVKQDGLRAIKEILDEDSEINIYFVLPKDIFENFKTKQPYKNKGDGKRFDAWINNIVQYALCIDLDKYCGEL